MTSELITDRLRLHPVRPEDYENLCLLHGDEEVMALMHHGVETPEQTRLTLDTYLDVWKTHGLGIWIVHSIDDGAFAGECGFRFVNDQDGPGIRFCFLKSHWGKGLAQEASRAVIKYAFEEAGFNRVLAVSQLANQSSIGLISELGYTLIDDRFEGIEDLHLHELISENWHQSS